MANRIEPFVVTIPAGTAIASFQRTAVTFPDGKVTRLEITVPPGPSGLVGFRIAHSGQSVIPPQRDIWNVADNQQFDWGMEQYPWGGSWEVWAYNLDVYIHSLYLWFHVSDTDRVSLAAGTFASIAPGGMAEDDDDSLAIADS